MSKKYTYEEKISALNESESKLLAQQEKIASELKEIRTKKKVLENEQTQKELDKTVVELNKRGLSVADILKAIESGSFEQLQNKVAGDKSSEN